MSTFFIPEKIRVGFQNRVSTYTGKLGYVIYYDEKGKLRKENSWSSWRDKSIDCEEFDNEPLSGFVLNKKVGGYKSGWNHRNSYVRMYDPRGFEFEISIENLLYILENTTSTKGKGLEGEFIYSWSGADLVLVPCGAPDYIEMEKLNKLRHSNKKIGARDLSIGGEYRSKDNNILVYMGKFEEHYYGRIRKRFWFYHAKSGLFSTYASIPRNIVEEISSESVDNYAEIFHKMEGNPNYSPIDDSKSEYEDYGKDYMESEIAENGSYSSFRFYVKDGDEYVKHHLDYGSNKYVYKKSNDWWIDEDKVEFDSLDEFYDAVKPLKKLVYLKNGRFYKEVR